MKGITYGDYHTYRDFGLVLSSWEIEPPTPKTEIVEVPGADKPLDFTEFFGDVHYDNRKATFEFFLPAPRIEILRIFSEIQNRIHGKKMHITTDEDPKFYYIGRVSVKECVIEKTIGKVTIECDCEPYKYKLYPTIYKFDVSGTMTVYLENLRQHVVPVFKSTGTIKVTFGSQSASSTGEFTIPELVLKEGVNTLKLQGTANVTITYQEGGL